MEGTYVWQEIHLAMGEIRNQFLAVNEAVDLLNRRAADEVVSATRRTRSTVLISSVSGAGFLLLWGFGLRPVDSAQPFGRDRPGAIGGDRGDDGFRNGFRSWNAPVSLAKSESDPNQI